MTTTRAYRGFVFTITYRVEEPGYIVRFTDILEIITSGNLASSSISVDSPRSRASRTCVAFAAAARSTTWRRLDAARALSPVRYSTS
jgi:isopenicillin N synthase-like dioxygenase